MVHLTVLDCSLLFVQDVTDEEQKSLAYDAFHILAMPAGFVQDVTDEEQKGLAHDAFHSLVMSAGFVQDVTNTDCWAQHDSTHSCVSVASKY